MEAERRAQRLFEAAHDEAAGAEQHERQRHLRHDRAAAQACARNAAALFVPCHRIVRADGSLGGFRWGVETKRRLLALEGLELAL